MEFPSQHRKSEYRTKCCVKGCDSKMNKNKNLSIHKVPKSGINIEIENLFGKLESVDKRAEWLRRLKIKDESKQVVIFSKHFGPDNYCFPGNIYLINKTKFFVQKKLNIDQSTKIIVFQIYLPKNES